jgi:outer membrane protein assembly factor BamB
MPGTHFVRGPLATAPARRPRLLAALVALALAACGGNDNPSGPGSGSVDRVVLGGVPTIPVLAGTTIQLEATPVTAAGVALSRTVSWRTSDSTVATVDPSGRVSVVGAGPVTITAACEGKEGSATLDARASAVVPPGGGTLTLLDGRVTLTVPGGAAGQGARLLVRPAPAPPQNGRTVPGTAYELGPAELEFRVAATLSLGYDPARLPAGLSESTLQLYRVGEGAWKLVRGSRVDVATHQVSGAIYGAGVYTVASTAIDRVVLEGTPRGVALYAGAAFSAKATAFDVDRDTLPTAVFTWTSSNPAIAAVDGQGRVTGQAPGTTTLTAALDGKQASTVLTVLPRPIPSWSQAEEWGTYQGNARHDGHVSATLDPTVFRELWSRTVVGASLNPVATGNGKVFVSTHAHFSTQLLFALDAATGSQSWSRDFGEIASVGPPAFGNGRVYVTTGAHEDAFLWSMDAADGRERFSSPYRSQFYRWLAPVVTPAGVYMAGGYSGGAYRFDAVDGTETWAVTLPQVDDWTPAVAGGQVFVYGELDVYTGRGLTVLNAGTGALAYRVDDARLPSAGTPVLGGAGNVLTIANGSLFSTSLQARAVQWEVQGRFAGMPSVSGGVVYARNDFGVDARRESDGTLLWSWTPPAGPAQGDMVLTDNLLFVRVNSPLDADYTYAVDLASGKHVWFYPAVGSLALSAQGTLFIASDNGRLVAVAVR